MTDAKPKPTQHEPPMTVDYWRSTGCGGTLLLEYEIERKGPHSQSRRADGVIVLGTETKIVSRGPVPALNAEDVEVVGKEPWPPLDGEDVVVVQTKARPPGLPLLGQALLSPRLIELLWKPRTLRSTAVYAGGADPAISALMERFHLESYPVPPEVQPATGGVDPDLPHLGQEALDWIHRHLRGEMVLGAWIRSDQGHRLMRAEALIIHDRPFGVVKLPATPPPMEEVIEGQRITLVATSLKGGMSTAGEAVFGLDLLLAAHPAEVNAVLLMGFFDESIAAAVRSFPGVTPVAYLG